MGSKTTSEKEGLLTIGTVAKSFGVNENTIRRIEAAGLLKPAYIAENSGYRYYDRENISLLAEIFSLRSFGFVYEDLNEYFKTPGDYSVLFEKLLEKQAAIDLLIQRFGRRLNTPDRLTCRIIQYAEAKCLFRKIRIVPNLKDIFDISVEFLFDIIQDGHPIDYTRALMILTDFTDYRTICWDSPREFTFCIPVMDSISPEIDLLHIPSSKAVSCGWTNAAGVNQGLQDVIEIIGRELAEHHLSQSGVLRVSFDICGYMGSGTAPRDTVIHFMVPFQ